MKKITVITCPDCLTEKLVQLPDKTWKCEECGYEQNPFGTKAGELVYQN